jgi:hypothetical protein
MKTDKAGCSRREPMLPGDKGRSAALAAEITAAYVRDVTPQADLDLAARFGVSEAGYIENSVRRSWTKALRSQKRFTFGFLLTVYSLHGLVRFLKGDTIMLTKTSIALAVIVAICVGAVAAERRHHPAANAYSRSLPVNPCAHGVWDAYGVRCDSGVE